MLSSTFRYLRFFLLFIFLFPGFQSAAQFLPDTSATEQESSDPQFPEDPLGRNNPRGTVRGFISAVADRNYELASQYLNLEGAQVGSKKGQDLAMVLQRLLDKGGLVPYSRISNDPEGLTDDELPAGIDRIGTITSDDQTIDVLVEVTMGPEGGPIWLFAGETIEVISDVTVVNPLLIDRILPAFLQNYLVGGAPIGHWLAIFVLAGLAYFLAWMVTSLFRLLVRTFWPKAAEDPTAGIIQALVLPVMLILAGWLFVFLSREVGITIVLRQRFNVLTMILGVVAVLLLLWQLVGFIGDFSKKRMLQLGNVSGMSIVLFLQRAARVTILILGFIAILGVLGINVTAGLAALGIGGIALALGAQKTIENLVGSVTVVADQPVRVGDFCRFGDTVGTVERIGMRSTRIRTLARTIVTIPNGEFASAKIENFAHRDRFLFNPALNLRYETKPDQIRYLLVELRSILYSHPMVSPDPARIRFTRLGSASLDLEVFSYVLAKNFDEFLEVQEDLLLRMMDVVEASGSGFAFPSQTIYFARDGGVSEEKAKEAGEKVKQWKDQNDLQIPRFNPSKIEDLKNTIAFPPEGSAKS